MNIKGFRRMLFGEKMPDKNDPQYKDRYEREVTAGRKFAQATRFGLAIGGFVWNIYRLTVAYHYSHTMRTATEMQDSVLRERHKRLQRIEMRENKADEPQ